MRLGHHVHGPAKHADVFKMEMSAGQKWKKGKERMKERWGEGEERRKEREG